MTQASLRAHVNARWGHENAFSWKLSYVLATAYRLTRVTTTAWKLRRLIDEIATLMTLFALRQLLHVIFNKLEIGLDIFN